MNVHPLVLLEITIFYQLNFSTLTMLRVKATPWQRVHPARNSIERSLSPKLTPLLPTWMLCIKHLGPIHTPFSDTMKKLTQAVFLFTGLTCWVSALTVEKRGSVATVLADISNLASSLKTLDSTINSLPEEGLAGALAIEQDVNNTIALLQKTHSDVIAAGPVDSTDANSVLTAVQNIKPVIIKTLDDFVAQKSEVQKLNGELAGLTQLAESDLKALDGNTSAVESALISAAPASLRPTASLISSSISAAFQTAIAAYAD